MRKLLGALSLATAALGIQLAPALAEASALNTVASHHVVVLRSPVRVHRAHYRAAPFVAIGHRRHHAYVIR